MQLRTQKALLWLSVDVVGSQAVPFAAFLIIARVISPEEYGSFALAMALIGLINIVLYQGLADALIRDDHPDDVCLATAFWLNGLLSAIIIIIVQVTAGLVARLYHAPQMEEVLRWLSLLAPIQAFASIHVALFRRNLETAVLARRTVIGRLAGAAAGIGLAVAGFGIWSLVALQITQAAVAGAILWIASSWQPRLVFSPRYAGGLLRFGSRYLGGSLATALVTVIDSLIVGLLFDPKTVGIYVMASRLLEMVTTLILVPMRLLVLPVLCPAAGKQEEFNALYQGMVMPAFLFWMPLVLLLGAGAELLVPACFGEKWTEAVPIMWAMCLTAFTTPVWFFAGQALSAAGRPDLFLRTAAVHVVVMALCVTAGSSFGVVGVGFGFAVSSALMIPISVAALRRVSGLEWRVVFWPSLKVCLAGSALLFCSIAARYTGAVLPLAPSVLSAMGAAMGLLAYLGLIEYAFLPGQITRRLRDFRNLLGSRWKKAPV